jgi:integrase
MTYLFGGCRCSTLTIFPSDWNEAGASLKTDWYIQYRFYDPQIIFEKGKNAGKIKPKLCIVKGMNVFKTLAERRESTKILLKDEWHALTQDGYNPISGLFMNLTEEQVDKNEFDIAAETPFIEALCKAHRILECSPGVKANINSMLNFIKPSAQRLRFDQLTVGDIWKKHIRKIFADLKKNKKTFSAGQQNMYRAWLRMLFSEIDALKYNPVSDVKKIKEIKKIKPVLDDQAMRKKIDTHLHENCYTFWRFMQIFFYSGAREKELLELQEFNVDLKRQKYKCIVYKGRQPHEVERTIRDSALPLWKEIMALANAGEYLFSKGLIPGTVPINYKQISRRWNRWVKKPFDIDINFYRLKALNTTETIDHLQEELNLSESTKLAARQNGHTSDAMVVNIYDVKRADREHEQLKKVPNKFA